MERGTAVGTVLTFPTWAEVAELALRPVDWIAASHTRMTVFFFAVLAYHLLTRPAHVWIP